MKHYDVKSFSIANYGMLIQGICVTPIVAIGWHNVAWLCQVPWSISKRERVMTIVDSGDPDGWLVLIIIKITKHLNGI